MAPPDLLQVSVGTTRPYSVHIGPEASLQVPSWLIGEGIASRYALVTDSIIAPLHAHGLLDHMRASGLETALVIVPAGEGSKTRQTKQLIEDQMLDQGLGRDAAVIALGGGMITDLAGFVAATYMRGIPLIQVPTTLLAMVDASVGGKTGVDHPKGKNLIGAFHQPSAVFIDTRFLETLPDRQYRAGLAEILKAAVIHDAGLFERMSAEAEGVKAREPALLTRLIADACRIKAEVVAGDERETDRRKVLNFGHTIGHALELLSGYSLSHGEAVAIGMVVEARLSVRMGLLPAAAAASIESAVRLLGLPTGLPAVAARSPERVLEAARHDKKARAGRLAYALPSAIGSMARGAEGFGLFVPDTKVLEVLAEMTGTDRLS